MRGTGTVDGTQLDVEISGLCEGWTRCSPTLTAAGDFVIRDLPIKDHPTIVRLER